MPVLAAQFSRVAEQAVREQKSHRGDLEVLLQAEIEEREQNTVERRTTFAVGTFGQPTPG